ncbi:MAG: hypothetical protein GX868_11520, partial [Actinobacteria bacterium]|nr:hypothetical protein [Actinomycetota bacterium]
VVHRVEAVEPERRSYRTRGDANTARDGAAVPYDRVDGVGQMLVPLMGFPLLWVRQPAWAPLLVCLLGVVAIAWPLVVDGLRDPHTTPGRDRSIPLSAFTAVVAEGLGSGGGQRNDRAST